MLQVSNQDTQKRRYQEASRNKRACRQVTSSERPPVEEGFRACEARGPLPASLISSAPALQPHELTACAKLVGFSSSRSTVIVSLRTRQPHSNRGKREKAALHRHADRNDVRLKPMGLQVAQLVRCRVLVRASAVAVLGRIAELGSDALAGVHWGEV